jgi:hypothetical protein
MTIEQLIEIAEKESVGNSTKKAMYEIYLHLNLLKDIMNSGDCNTCTSQGSCPIAPKPGERVRYNCAFYKGGDK